MLEERQLLLGPWSRPAADRTGVAASRRRTVFDAATQAPLGHVCWRPDEVPAWLAWLARPRFEIYETDDASLLFTVQRVRGPWSYWKVTEADDRLVGYCWHRAAARAPFDAQLANASGSVFARLVPEPGNGSGCFRLGGGDELGAIRPGASGWLLSFSPRSAGNPFVRMLLLAAVLPLDAV